MNGDTENSENRQCTFRRYKLNLIKLSFISQLDLNPCKNKKKTKIWIHPEEDNKNSENHQCTFKRYSVYGLSAFVHFTAGYKSIKKIKKI
jgi:hypothetical protein